MQCRDCKWFDNTVQKPGASDPDKTGMCRASLPVMQKGEHPWPFCRLTDWCSRFTVKAD